MDVSQFDESAIRELVRRAQEGDRDAFASVYDQFFAPVYRYVAFRLPPEVAEDVTAEIFIRAWEKLHRYRVHRSIPFGAWLFRIARHKVIDVYRTQRGFEEVPEHLEDTDAMNRPQDRLERADRVRIVREALDKLPRRYRDVLLLSFVSDLPHSAVARVLHMTEGGVRVRKLRALRRLQELLPPEMAKEL
jgi:RNA polymerase sigma-70 factor (ECF subfamily)